MKNYTYEQLTASGYRIENALITNVDLSMADHGCLTLVMTLEGGGWGVVRHRKGPDAGGASGPWDSAYSGATIKTIRRCWGFCHLNCPRATHSGS